MNTDNENVCKNLTKKMTFTVQAHKENSHGSIVKCKDAQLTVDTDLKGRIDAFNPAELLMAALSACIIKGINRVVPILNFNLQGVEVEINVVRQDVPPKMESISYVIKVDTDESDHRLALLHDNVKKYGTVYNTLAEGTMLSGQLIRK